MAEAKDFDEKQFAEMIGGTVAIQVRTNHLLHDHKEGLLLENEDCQLLSSMDGKEIRRELPMMLAVGLGCCLEKISDGSNGSNMRKSLTAMFDDMGLEKEVQDVMFGPILRKFDECAKHELPFEIAEYLDEESIVALSRGMAVMMDAFLSGSTITIE